MERIFHYTADEESDGKTIKEYLKAKSFSTALIAKLKQHKRGILLNGERVFVNTLLCAGDRLELLIEDENTASEDIIPVKGQPDIIYEDDDILVINKPPFLPVHPSKGHPYDSLANIVAYYYDLKDQRFVFRCVNRLDKNTSGVTIIAKNSFVHEALRQQIMSGQFVKEYIAVVHGQLIPTNGIIDAPIYRPEEASIKRVISPMGKNAITRYEVLTFNKKYSDNGISVLKVFIETGRTHQIRVHFSHIGHPLAGDFLYGDENDGLINRQALHCGKIKLIHPLTGKELVFETKLPEDMQKLI